MGGKIQTCKDMDMAPEAADVDKRCQQKLWRCSIFHITDSERGGGQREALEPDIPGRSDGCG